MNPEFPDDPSATISDFTKKGREALADAQLQAGDVVESARNYVRANPWVAVTGALLIGGVIGAACRSGGSRPADKWDVLRGWLDEASAKLPTQKQVQSAAESTGIPDLLKQLGKKLHTS